MHIEELAAGLGITFYVNTYDGQQMLFESSITEVDPKKHLVLAEAITKDEKVVSLKGKGITVDMVAAIPDEKPILFKNVQVETLKLDQNSFCYNVVTPKEGSNFNRREAYRCFVGNPTTLRNGKDMEDHDVVIKDVSVSGFAITCGGELELEPGQLVHVLLEDYIEEIDREYSFHLYGLMVRKQELEHGKVIYGFRLNNHVGGLENYLTQKERIRLRNSRGK